MGRKFLTAFVFLGLAVIGGCYLYGTSQGFRNLMESILQPDKQRGDSIDTVTPIVVEKKGGEAIKSEIPKSIKPDAFFAIDEYARKVPKQYEKDIPTLAEYLTGKVTTDIEKVRVIFTWVATHIKYDAEAYNSDNYPDYSAENVLVTRKAVCEGYSNLMEALCKAAGLEAKKITGYAKGYSYKQGSKFKETNHAWNVVKADKQWHLFDVTWASSYGTTQNGKLVSTSQFEPYWFDVHPKAFVFTHFPVEPAWQLTGGTMALSDFETLPYLSETFFKLGFNPSDVYAKALSGKITDFVETHSTKYPINASKLPLAKHIMDNEELTFEVESDYAEEVALIDDNQWHYFKKDHRIFTLLHKPTGKELQVCVKINRYDKSFSAIATYKIISAKPKV